MALFERPDYQGALDSAQRRRETAATVGPNVASLIGEKESELAVVEELREAGEMTLWAYAAEPRSTGRFSVRV